MVRRKRRGDTYLALSYDSAGNFGIATVPEKAKSAFADIADYNEEVFFVNHMAGLATVHKVRWADIESGEFFKKFEDLETDG
jgi:hypothetical protein